MLTRLSVLLLAAGPTAAPVSTGAGRHRQWGPPTLGSSRRQPGVDIWRAALVLNASQCPNDAQHDAQPCLQALINKMHEMPIDPSVGRRHPNPSRFIFLPSGEYLINSPLVVNVSKAISIVGDSVVGATIVANASMEAMLHFLAPGPEPDSSATYLQDIGFEGRSMANHCVLAPSLIESTFLRVSAQYCLLTGIYVGMGYTNLVNECTLLANGVQLALGGINNMEITNSMLGDGAQQPGGPGLYGFGGMQWLIQGNLFEGNGGPGIILTDTAAVSIHNNYFECNEGEAQGATVQPTMVLHPLATGPHANASTIAVRSDIVLTGEFACPGPMHWPCSGWNTPDPSWGGVIWRYGVTYPNTRTIISANSHDMHHPEATAVLAIASRELTMIGSSCGELSGKNGCSASKKFYGTKAEVHPAMASLAFGVEPGLFDIGTITIEGAGGWGWVNNVSSNRSDDLIAAPARLVAPRASSVSNDGLLRIMAPSSGANASSSRYGSSATQSYGGTQGIACHTLDIRSATPGLFPGRQNFAHATPLPISQGSGVSATAAKLSAGPLIDGLPRHRVTCGGGGGGSGNGACSVQLGMADLGESPSLAGQAAYVAVQIRAVPTNASSSRGSAQVPRDAAVVGQLKIFDGESWLLSTDAAAPLPLPADGEWVLLTMCALALPWTGVATFELEVRSSGGGQGVVEVGKVVIAKVGTPWGSAL